MIRILHIVPDIGLGGVFNVALNLSNTFPELGVHISLATSIPFIETSFSKKIFHIKLRRMPSIYSLQKLWLWLMSNKDLIEKFIYKYKPNVILTHGHLIMLRNLINYKKSIWVTIVHGTYANEILWMHNHPIYGIEKIKYIVGIELEFKHDMKIYRYITKKFPDTFIIAVSKKTRQELIKQKIPSHKIYAVLNGVNKKVFYPINRNMANMHIKKILRKKLNKRILLHVNPGPRKGTHTLINALPLVLREFSDIILIVIGNLKPLSYRKYLKNLVKALKLKDNVIFTGYLPDHELPYFYNASDIVIVPSYSEGGPLITPEALACNTPVIATNVGGNLEYLQSVNLKKYLIEVNQYDFHFKIATKILNVIGIEKHIDINNVPSWYDTASKYLSIFKNIINNISI